MPEMYSTGDIWLGSYFLSESDARLVDVHITRNGQGTIAFSFEGEDLSDFATAYCREQAKANVAKMREKINFLRDIIFQSKKRI